MNPYVVEYSLDPYSFFSDDEDYDEDEDEDVNGGRRRQDQDNASYESTHTLTNETFNNPASHGNNKHDRAADASNEEESTEAPTSSASSPFSGGSGDADDANNCDGGISSAISSASISLPPTPADTPVPARRTSSSQRQHRKHVRNDNESTAATIAAPRKATDNDGKNAGIRSAKKKRNRLGDVREVVEEHEQDTDSSVSQVRIGRRVSRRGAAIRQLSVSNATLTNVSHFPILHIQFL